MKADRVSGRGTDDPNMSGNTNNAGHRGLGEWLSGSVVFPAWVRREHPGYTRWRREFERSQFWSAERLAAAQHARLRELLRYAWDHCPLYHRRLEAAGYEAAAASPGRERWDEMWQRMPLLRKADIQAHGAALQAEGFPAAQRSRNQTGGSTGSPLQFYVDRQRYASRMASTHRHNAWAGLRPGDWVAQIWGNRLDLQASESLWDRTRRRLLYRTLDLNSSSISAGDWENYVACLRRFRPRFLIAYARAAAEFARFVRDRGITDLGFTAIITSAEVLLPAHRRLLEEVFHARVYNRYGCREVSVIASECGAGSGLHVNAEALLVEIVPTPELPAPWGKVVVTDLFNRSMPLIRYEIGDAGHWLEGRCECGRGLPRLASVEGRTTDFLRLPDGRVVSGPALTLVMADMASVRQVQFVQRASGDVLLRLVAGTGYGPDQEAELRRRLHLYLRGVVPLTICPVESIASEASGKYRFVVQEKIEEGAVTV